MSKFLTYSDVDNKIQNKLSNQAPDEDTRLEAINDVLRNLYSDYDIETGKREYNFYAIPDGEENDIEGQTPDLKKVSDLRYLDKDKQDAEYVLRDDDEFQVNIGRGVSLDEYAVVYNNGKQYLKLNTSNGLTKIGLHNMGGYNDNGTWTADTTNGDATTVADETVRTLTQGTSISFNVDVSQSANNYALIYNSDMTAIDLSDYKNQGITKFWIYIPSVTNFTSVELRWGSSASAYWSLAVTAQHNGASFVAGWNRVSFDWADATETGTVDEDNIDYLAVKCNYAAGYTDQTGFVVEAIEMFLPLAYKMVYYTYYKSQTTANLFQDDLTNTATDEILLPQRYKDLVVYMALVDLAPMALGDDLEVQSRKWQSIVMSEKRNLGLDIGNRIKSSVKKIKLRVQ